MRFSVSCICLYVLLSFTTAAIGEVCETVDSEDCDTIYEFWTCGDWECWEGEEKWWCDEYAYSQVPTSWQYDLDPRSVEQEEYGYTQWEDDHDTNCAGWDECKIDCNWNGAKYVCNIYAPWEPHASGYWQDANWVEALGGEVCQGDFE